MQNLTITDKYTLMKFYQEVENTKHHHIKRIAEEYEIPRREAIDAYNEGAWLFDEYRAYEDGLL